MSMSHVLKGTYRCIDTLFSILDKDWNFPRTRGLEDLGELRNSLLENLRGANVNLGYDNHDWYIQCKSNTEVLP